jgi:hypothetical protein
MIDAASVGQIFAVYAGCWALGYAVGLQVAYVKKMLGAS